MEGDEPVDNIFSEKVKRLLTETLYNSCKPLPDEEKTDVPRPFLAAANVGIFLSVHKSPLVPDVYDGRIYSGNMGKCRMLWLKSFQIKKPANSTTN